MDSQKILYKCRQTGEDGEEGEDAWYLETIADALAWLKRFAEDRRKVDALPPWARAADEADSISRESTRVSSREEKKTMFFLTPS